MEVRPIIFYKTTADFNNTGEVLIYKTLLENLRKYGNVIVDDSPHIQSLFLERIGITENEKLHRYTKLSFTSYILLVALKNVMTRNPIYFVTGVGDHVVNGGLGAIKNFVSFLFLLLIRIGGIQVLRIGMSIKFNGKLAEFSERMLSVVIPNYYVRDSLSLKNCICAKINAKLAPDLSWGYKISVDKANINGHVVIFSFRDYIRKQQQEPYKSDLYNGIGKLIEYITQKYNVIIRLTYQCDYDRQVQLEIFERFKHLGNLEFVDELITLQNAKEYYGQARVIVTNRLHVLLLGYKYGALTVGYTDMKTHEKISGVFCDENLENHIIELYQSHKNALSEFDSLWRNTEQQWLKIHNVEENNYKKLNKIFERVFYQEN